MKVEFINPITNKQDYLELKFRDIDYFKWRDYNREGEYEDAEFKLGNLLHKLDCTKEFKSGRPMMTIFPIYQLCLSDYYYWLSKITDYILYNIWLDKLILRHIKNLQFEYEHPYIKNVSKKKTTKKKSIIIWTRQETKDLFNDKPMYVYQNLRTGEYFISDDFNKLEELNKQEKKVIKSKSKFKSKDAPLSAMTFSFKK